MKKAIIPATIILILALVIAIGSQSFLGACVHEDGSFGACHWAGRAMLGMGALMAAMALGQDANFSEEAFVTRFNADLANNLGNLLSRTTKMVEKNFAGKLPPASEPGQEEQELIASVQNAVTSMRNAIENMQLDRGIAEVMVAANATNRYFDTMKPWVLAKAGDTAALARVLRNTAEALRIIAGLLYPVMPNKMTELRRLLGVPEERVTPVMDQLEHWNQLPDDATVGTLATPLFPRIDLAKA